MYWGGAPTKNKTWAALAWIGKNTPYINRILQTIETGYKIRNRRKYGDADPWILTSIADVLRYFGIPVYRYKPGQRLRNVIIEEMRRGNIF